MMVFTGNANPILAKKVVERLAIPLGEASISKFSDGEVAIDLIENVRGADVFIIQPTCQPTNDILTSAMPAKIADRAHRAHRFRPRPWPICLPWSA
jgi:ribose-phosphate pyrophosphokinase